jgi:DNA-binding NarL/FixJ family response regulator
MARLRVFLISAWPLVRLGLNQCLRGEFEIIGMSASGKADLDHIKVAQPDVVLIDLASEPLASLGLVWELYRCHIPVVSISRCQNVDTVLRALNSGVQVYLLENSSRHQLLDAINGARDGVKRVSDPALKAALLSYAIGTRTSGWADGLRASTERKEPTARERAVIRLLMRGLTNRNIAETLGIREKTVEAHLSSLFRKFEVHSRTELVLFLSREPSLVS